MSAFRKQNQFLSAVAFDFYSHSPYFKNPIKIAFVSLILMFDFADIDGVLQNLIETAFIKCLATDNASVFSRALLA